jgi:hypothetical protein
LCCRIAPANEMLCRLAGIIPAYLRNPTIPTKKKLNSYKVSPGVVLYL